MKIKIFLTLSAVASATIARMHKKDFTKWNTLKQDLHQKRPEHIVFKERDIWWCSIGCNIGDEEDGKHDLFSRPVLILKKFNKNIFYGLPMTTKNKENLYYVPVTFKGKVVSVLISHMRLLDKKRLGRRLGHLDTKDFNKVMDLFKQMF
jgi:mRNA interferase MazF